MSRARGWEYFINTFAKFAEAVTSTVQAATAVAPAFSAQQAARLDVVLAKATRAKQILQQLQEYDSRHRRLQQEYQPLVARLPQLQQQLPPDQLLAAAEFAASQGMQEPLSQVTGKAGQSSLCVTDPYGIRIALRKGHPLSLLTWQEYLSVIQRAAAACEQLLPGQALQQLMAFSREQRNLVSELEALRLQLKEEAPIPLLQPLQEDCERLEQLVQGLVAVQAAHVAMLRRDLAHLDLGLLELRLKLQLGEGEFAATPAAAALQRLRMLHAQVTDSSSRSSSSSSGTTDSWQRQALPHATAATAAAMHAAQTLQQDLEALAALLQRRQQQQQETQDLVELNIQRFQRSLFERLSQLQGAAQQ